MTLNILVLNAGSSSFKASLYQLTEDNLPSDPAVALWTGEVDWNSSETAVLKANTANHSVREDRFPTGDASAQAEAPPTRTETTRISDVRWRWLNLGGVLRRRWGLRRWMV
jgi:hypothetical protein